MCCTTFIGPRALLWADMLLSLRDVNRVAAIPGLVAMGKYSDTLMDHFMRLRNSGPLESPDVTGHAGTPGRGPFLILYLRIEEGQVAAAKNGINAEPKDIASSFTKS